MRSKNIFTPGYKIQVYLNSWFMRSKTMFTPGKEIPIASFKSCSLRGNPGKETKYY